MSQNTPTMYALLVGINEWVSPVLPKLDGCVNDVQAMASVLRERFRVPDENINTLTNQQATHQAIKQAFRDHLIGNARRWSEDKESAESPAFVLHYAGHGSRATDSSGTQPDGLDETIVPFDSRTEGVYDIRDWELGQLLDELAQYTNNVTVLLDCCHSGSGTREAGTQAKRRVCEPDLRPQPTQRPIQSDTRQAGRDASSAGEGQHVLIAACRSHECAQEYVVREGDGVRVQGAMTYFLSRELAALPQSHSVTYRQLHERLRHEVNSRYASQMPQCEGDRDRVLFGGIRPEREPLMSVVDVKDGEVVIDAGIIHGLTDGSLLSVHPPETQSRGANAPSMAMLRVVHARALQCSCTPEPGSEPVPLHAKVAVERASYGDLRRGVAVAVSEQEVCDKIRGRLSADDTNSYLELIDEGKLADFQICLRGERIEIWDRSGTPLVADFDTDDVDGLARDLMGLVRYFNALELKNRSPASRLSGQISLSAHEVVSDDESASIAAAADVPVRKVRGVRPIAQSADGEPVVVMGKPIALAVTNHADVPVYCEIVNFTFDYEIRLLYQLFQGTHKRIAAGGTEWIGREGPPLQFELPGNLAERKRFVEAREFVKVIATVDEADFSLLEQDSLKTPYSKRAVTDSALSGLLHQAMAGGRERALGPVCTSPDADWTTAELEYIVTRSDDAGRHRLSGS